MELTCASLNQKSANAGGFLDVVVVYRAAKTMYRRDGSGSWAKMLIRFATKGDTPDGLWGILTAADEATLTRVAEVYAVGATGKLKSIQMVDDKYLCGKVINLTKSRKPNQRSTSWTPLENGAAMFQATPTLWALPIQDLSTFTMITATTYTSLVGKLVELSDTKPPEGDRKDPVKDAILKDLSDTVVDCSLWGVTLTTMPMKVGDIILVDNAKIRPGKVDGKVRISCEHYGDSAHGHCIVLLNPAGPITEQLKAVADLGGNRISDEYKSAGRVPIDPDGDAQVTTLSHLRAAPEKDLFDVTVGNEKFQKLATTLRFQIHGAWLTSLRVPTVYIECTECHTKIDEETTKCKRAPTGCRTTPGALKCISHATLSDASGSFADIGIANSSLLLFTQSRDEQHLQSKVANEDQLTMLTRADVRLGTNSAKTDSNNCSFELLQVFPFVLRDWVPPPPDRPNALRAVCLASEVDGAAICPINSPTDLTVAALGNFYLGAVTCAKVLALVGSNEKAKTVKATVDGKDKVHLTFPECVSLLDDQNITFELQAFCNLEDVGDDALGNRQKPHLVAGEMVWDRTAKKFSLMAEYVREIDTALDYKGMFSGEVQTMKKLLHKPDIEFARSKRKSLSIREVDVHNVARPSKMQKSGHAIH